MNARDLVEGPLANRNLSDNQLTALVEKLYKMSSRNDDARTVNEVEAELNAMCSRADNGSIGARVRGHAHHYRILAVWYACRAASHPREGGGRLLPVITWAAAAGAKP